MASEALFYKPGKSPDAQEKETKELGLFLERELGRVSDGFTEHYYVKYQVLHVAPDRPREGMTVYADGSNWNPGHGKGVYVWNGSVWAPHSGQAGAAFSAHKGGAVQAGLVSGVGTQITFGLELYDIGGFYNTGTSLWTPPAGRVSLSAGFIMDGSAAYGHYTYIAIMKNGVTHKLLYNGVMASLYGVSAISLQDVANGTDTYGVIGAMTLAAGTASVRGSAHETWFTGHWVGI